MDPILLWFPVFAVCVILVVALLRNYGSQIHTLSMVDKAKPLLAGKVKPFWAWFIANAMLLLGLPIGALVLCVGFERIFPNWAIGYRQTGGPTWLELTVMVGALGLVLTVSAAGDEQKKWKGYAVKLILLFIGAAVVPSLVVGAPSHLSPACGRDRACQERFTADRYQARLRSVRSPVSSDTVGCPGAMTFKVGTVPVAIPQKQCQLVWHKPAVNLTITGVEPKTNRACEYPYGPGNKSLFFNCIPKTMRAQSETSVTISYCYAPQKERIQLLKEDCTPM